jgi:hypothetical protein
MPSPEKRVRVERGLRGGTMIARWRAAPATIKAWIFLGLAIVSVVALPGEPDFGNSGLASLFWLGLWSVLLLRRSQVAWWLIVVLSGFGLIVMLLGVPAADAPHALVVVFGLLYAASLVALLMPSARRWVQPRAKDGSTPPFNHSAAQSRPLRWR